MVKDPVCGMDVDEKAPLKSTHEGKNFEGRQKRNMTMNTKALKILGPGIFIAVALALAGGADAQAPAPAPSAAATRAQPASMDGKHKHGAAAASNGADMKVDCQAMMAKKQEIQDKMQAMDATLDRLVAEMNAAAGSKEVDAMEKPIAAVLNELVAQRKASRAMAAQKESSMMSHMMGHMKAKGSMECPMMKAEHMHGSKSGESQPKM